MPAAATPENYGLNRRVVLLAVCLGAFMATLDTSIVNIALPQIARDFHCSLVQISWVMLIYLLMNVSLLLTSGRLGDLLAPGKLFLLGLLIFTGASALCGFSPALAWMVAARALQGIGGSLMLGVAPKLIALTYSEGERGLALGLFSTAFATGISVGAPLGGIITTYLGWPFIFYINIPICVVAFGVGSRVLAPIRAQKAWNWRSFDLGGGVILAATLGLFLLGLTWIRQIGLERSDPGSLGRRGAPGPGAALPGTPSPRTPAAPGTLAPLALYRGVRRRGADLCPGHGDLLSAAVFSGTDLSLHPGSNRVLVGGLKCEQCPGGPLWRVFGGPAGQPADPADRRRLDPGRLDISRSSPAWRVPPWPWRPGSWSWASGSASSRPPISMKF